MKLMGMLWLMGLTLLSASCSQESKVPESQAMQPGLELNSKQPLPGNYTIGQFVYSGQDLSARFDGYTFIFSPDGNFVAITPETEKFNGRWLMNHTQTEVLLLNAGTPALDNLCNRHWQVDKITNKGMKFTDGANEVVFRPDER